MRVVIHDGNTGDVVSRGKDLQDCSPDAAPDDPEVLEAYDALQRIGRFWIGGGAAALFLLTVDRETP